MRVHAYESLRACVCACTRLCVRKYKLQNNNKTLVDLFIFNDKNSTAHIEAGLEAREGKGIIVGKEQTNWN